MYTKTFLCALLAACAAMLQAKDYSVSRTGIAYYTLKNRATGTYLASTAEASPTLSPAPELWRVTRPEAGQLWLDAAPRLNTPYARLRATSYLPMTLTTQGPEGRNDDVRWEFLPEGDGTLGLLRHRSSGYYLCADGGSVKVVRKLTESPAFRWIPELRQLRPEELESPILLMGDDHAGFRDPLLFFHDGCFYLYYTFVTTEDEAENIYWYVAVSTSKDLVRWSEPKILTEKDQNKNFTSPGSIVRFGDEWILCMQSYCMPGYKRSDGMRYGNGDCRLWIMRSKDLLNWSEPELMNITDDRGESPRRIDACITPDKDVPGKWWCFYCPQGGGLGYAWSTDFKTWHRYGRTGAGENSFVWSSNGRYYAMHSPHDGMGILESSDLKHWSVFTRPDNLGKPDWPWASRRVTAGAPLDLRDDPRVGRILMVFHGQGPNPQCTEIINSGTDLGIAWSDDYKTWNWPGKRTDAAYGPQVKPRHLLHTVQKPATPARRTP